MLVGRCSNLESARDGIAILSEERCCAGRQLKRLGTCTRAVEADNYQVLFDAAARCAFFTVVPAPALQRGKTEPVGCCAAALRRRKRLQNSGAAVGQWIRGAVWRVVARGVARGLKMEPYRTREVFIITVRRLRTKGAAGRVPAASRSTREGRELGSGGSSNPWASGWLGTE